MSLRRNVLASYASQIYVALVGILVTPLYLRLLGVEAYGLIGFFATLQIWFQLLDIGLSPSVSREVARHVGGAADALPLRRLLHGTERAFIAVALIGTALVALAAGPIASRWLHVQTLPLDEVRSCVQLMAAASGLRLLASMYRAAITGYERLAWLGAFNSATATAKAFLALPALAWLGGQPLVYFAVQLLVAALETATLAWQLHRLMPVRGATDSTAIPLRRLGRFSAGVALTTALNVALGQTDRLLLSALLPLQEFSYFSLATLVASAISLVSGPLGSVFTPRLAREAGAGDPQALLRSYRLALRMMCVAVFPAALTLAWHSRELLWAWTGNAQVSDHASPVLALYALGNSLAALAMVPYLLQFALGQLRYHIIGSCLFILLLIPGQFYLTQRFGAIGAGAFWVAVNGAYLLLWLPRTHRKLLPEVAWRDAIADVLGIAGASVAAAWLASMLPPLGPADSRIGAVATLGIAYALTLTAACACLPEVLRRLLRLASTAVPRT